MSGWALMKGWQIDVSTRYIRKDEVSNFEEDVLIWRSK
jgi:hypothetical protein